MKKVIIGLFFSFIVIGGIGCGAEIKSPYGSSNKHNLTMEKCENLYGDYSQAKWAQEVGYGDDKPLTTACYQALVAGPKFGLDGQMYIDSYNQGTFDFLEDTINNKKPISAEDIKAIQNMDYEYCDHLFSEVSSKQMGDMIFSMTVEANKKETSKDDRYNYHVSTMIIVHCRKLLYDE